MLNREYVVYELANGEKGLSVVFKEKNMSYCRRFYL